MKNSSLVSGGGKKPYKQKGTGRARQGSIRASQWVGGGKAMAPKARDYTYRPPKKVRKGALCAALSLRAREKALVIVDTFNLESTKTKATLALLTKRLKLKNALVVDEKKNTLLHRDRAQPGRLRRASPRGAEPRVAPQAEVAGADLRGGPGDQHRPGGWR